jgi:multiple sugar transport system substrate-binding protein
MGNRVWVTVVVVVLGLASSVTAKTTLSVGTWESLETWRATYSGQVALFEESNPDIGLDVMVIAGHSEFAAKIAVLAATGDLPDILKVPPEQVAPIAFGGVLENLEPWVTRDSSLNQSTWLAGALNAMYFNGIMFGFPAYVVNYTYGYNQEILANKGIVPPGSDQFVNWTQIRDIARLAREDRDGDGVPEIWGYHHGTGYTEILPLIFQAGGRVFDEEGLLDIDKPSTYEGLRWLIDMMAEGLHGGNSGDFWQRKTATRRIGSWEMKNILQAGTPVGAAGGIEQKVRTDMAYVTSFTMWSGSRNKEAAWRFLKYVVSKEAQRFIPPEGLVPMRRDVPLVEPYRNMLNGFVSSVTYSTSFPYHVHSDYIQSTVNRAMTPVWARQTTPEAVIPEVQRAINAYIIEQGKRR